MMTDLFLLAQIAGRSVAIASGHVDSVIDISEISPVPRAPGAVLGLAALRSRVVTVIDTRRALGLGQGTSTGRAVIVQVDGHPYAFLVDTLDDVCPFDLQPLANGVTLDPGWEAISLGLVEQAGEPVLAVDLARLVPTLAAAA